MARRLPRGIALDLAAVHATGLSLAVELSEVDSGSLLQHLGLDVTSASKTQFVSNYSREGRKHQAWAYLSSRRGKGPPRAIRLSYDLQPVEFGEQTRSIAELLQGLTELDVRAEADCFAAFEYSDDDWSSIVSLPWQPLRMEALPFDEFRGFRAIKTLEGEVLYNIIVDRATNREISHSLTFSYPARLDGRLPLSVLERAAEISRLFVLPKGTVEGTRSASR